MDYYESDFLVKLKELDEIIFKKEYLDLCNANENFRTIAPYVYLFRQYYLSVKTLLDTNNSCGIYPLARSACECFAIIYHLITTYETPQAFEDIVKREYQSNIKQLWSIWKYTKDTTLKNELFKRIKEQLIHIREINGTENDSIIENKAKSYDEPIQMKVVSAFSNIPGYSSDEESYNTLYKELCLYSHNNIDGIIERFFDNNKGQIHFNVYKKDINVNPTKYMFIACADYIITWLKRKV